MSNGLTAGQWAVVQAFVALLLISMTAYWVATQTSLLGPYGNCAPQYGGECDTYHILILVLLTFIAYMVATVTILRHFRVAGRKLG